MHSFAGVCRHEVGAYLAALHRVGLQRQVLRRVVLGVLGAHEFGARPADGADVAALGGLQQQSRHRRDRWGQVGCLVGLLGRRDGRVSNSARLLRPARAGACASSAHQLRKCANSSCFPTAMPCWLHGLDAWCCRWPVASTSCLFCAAPYCSSGPHWEPQHLPCWGQTP